MGAAIDMTVMATVRARWEKKQAAFIAQWEKTHDLDWCPLHGFWKLGPKMGGLLVATCPSCPSPDVVERLIRGE